MDDMFFVKSLQEFYNNPGGTGAAFGNKEAVKRDFIFRYDMIVKNGKKFKLNIYKEHDTSYYYHLIVPSELNENDYDVVIHLEDILNTGSSDLKKWAVDFFSNSPSFIYTYAFTYNENKILIDFLERKINDMALTDLPVTRNPNNAVGYDRTIFHAIHYLLNTSGVLNKTYASFKSKPLNKKEFFDIIRTDEEIMHEISLRSKQKVVYTVASSKSSKAAKAAKEVVKRTTHHVVKTVQQKTKRDDHRVKPKSKR